MNYLIKIGPAYYGRDGAIDAPLDGAFVFELFPTARFIAGLIRSAGYQVEVVQA